MKNLKESKKSKKSISPKNKKILIAASSAVLLLLIVGAVILFKPSKNFTIAFYKIEEKQRQGITEVINKAASAQNLQVFYVEYNAEKSLKEQIPLTKKPNIIITGSGFPVKTAVDKASGKAALPIDLTPGMTSSMRAGVQVNDGKITALPILSSHFEVDVDLAEFQNSNTKYINTWNDVEKFMREQKRKKESPMIFAGGNPDLLLDLMGAMAESIDGTESYNAAAKIIQTTDNPVRAAIKLCDEPDSPLATSVKQLKSWYKFGFIHPGTFSLQQNDVEAFASSRLSSVLFMTLENHRACAQKTISRYTSIYFPSEHGANSRIFTGKTYYAVPMLKSPKTEALLAALVTPEYQESLSRATGLAPVLAQCRTPDKQSDDARYWIASTTKPLAGLGHEAELTTEQLKKLSGVILNNLFF